MFKKTLSLIVALMLVVSLFTMMTAYADGDEPAPSEWVYTVLADDSVEITGYTGDAVEVEIPAEIDGKPVKSITGYQDNDYLWHSVFGESLTKVTIPDSVKKIGSYAFNGCTALTDIDFGSGVVNIGERAFSYCNKLATLTLPESVRNIGKWAFLGCIGLTELNIGEGVTNIEWGAFQQCTGLTELVVPDNVKKIDGWAFEECSGLTKVTLPEDIDTIGIAAFQSCTGLKTFRIPTGVKVIGTYAFQNDTALESVIIDKNVTSIGNWAFSGCDALKDIYFSGTKEEWDQITDGSTALTRPTIHFNSTGPEPMLLGDVDGDGEVTILDATAIQRKLASLDLDFEWDDKRADVDGDGEVTIIDATEIQRWLADLSENEKINKPIEAEDDEVPGKHLLVII